MKSLPQHNHDSFTWWSSTHRQMNSTNTRSGSDSSTWSPCLPFSGPGCTWPGFYPNPCVWPADWEPILKPVNQSVAKGPPTWRSSTEGLCSLSPSALEWVNFVNWLSFRWFLLVPSSMDMENEFNANNVVEFNWYIKLRSMIVAMNPRTLLSITMRRYIPCPSTGASWDGPQRKASGAGIWPFSTGWPPTVIAEYLTHLKPIG